MFCFVLNLLRQLQAAAVSLDVELPECMLNLMLLSRKSERRVRCSRYAKMFQLLELTITIDFLKRFCCNFRRDFLPFS